jgi:hypothetical protein
MAFFYAATQIPDNSSPPDPEAVIPSTSPFFGYAFNVATSLANLKLNAAGGPIYMLAVYNLATDNLINWVPPSNPVIYYPDVTDDDGDKIEYMTYVRQKYGINQFTPGVINASADEGTSASYEVLDQYKGYTLANLQQLKTPWGRQYLAFAADVGSLWGMS